MRGQSRNDQGAETASTWPVFRCSLPMALSCRAVARGALPRRDDPASCRPGSSWSTGQGRKPRRCQGSWPGSRRALRKLIVHGTAWFNLGCARWRPCLSLSHRDDARCQFRRQSGVMRGTVPHSHKVIQPTERTPPNPDGRARVRAAPGERPAQLREGGRCDDRWPACAQRTVVLRGGPATPGQEYLAMTAAPRGEPGHRSSAQPGGALDLPGPAGGRGGSDGSGGTRPGRSHVRTPTCWIRSCPGCR